MKRIVCYLAFAMAILAGCTKEEPKTTYSFIAEDDVVANSLEALHKYDYENATVDIMFAEYGGGHRLSFQKIEGAVDDKSYSFEANSNAEYVTVRVDITGEHDLYGEFEFIRYFANVIMLEKGTNTEIVFNGDTIMSENEPK